MSVADICDVIDVVEGSEHRRTSRSYDEERPTTSRRGLYQLLLKIISQHLASVSDIITHSHIRCRDRITTL